ncbi:hypothetical protein BTJ39_17535 [Izhakiella australiensis]|uniref:Uncharacterized protein n=2 Tax=Izhakiella australiensis TaxID=1926881 RepID=A0A1S8YIK2_9GAMM|nr:hypothetical protein BTJ39_17535 [Izhakiella australiensis]
MLAVLPFFALADSTGYYKAVHSNSQFVVHGDSISTIENNKERTIVCRGYKQNDSITDDGTPYTSLDWNKCSKSLLISFVIYNPKVNPDPVIFLFDNKGKLIWKDQVVNTANIAE